MVFSDRQQELEKELRAAQSKIVDLEASNKTTLTGGQFLTILMLGPLFLAFVALGVIIVYKVTSNPATVAPHLDVILLALSIFSLPVTSAAGVIVALMSDEIKAKIGGEKDG